MRKIMVKFERSFDASHHIPNHVKCGKLHGHTYHVGITISVMMASGVELHDGMLIDFGFLKEIVDRFDHTNLNDNFNYPTAEHIAENIAVRVEMAIEDVCRTYEGAATLDFIEVCVEEGENSSVTVGIYP